MNKDNHIDGRLLGGHHPLEDQWGKEKPVYAKEATVIAWPADNPGVIETTEAVMTFQAGDYIVTDNPPTHAWPIHKLVFESTYVEVGTSFEPRVHVPNVAPMMGVTEDARLDVRGMPQQGEPRSPSSTFREEARQAQIRSEKAAERIQKIAAQSPAPARAAAPRSAPSRPSAPSRSAKGK